MLKANGGKNGPQQMLMQHYYSIPNYSATVRIYFWQLVCLGTWADCRERFSFDTHEYYLVAMAVIVVPHEPF